MENVINQSRTALDIKRSNFLYFFFHIFHFLFKLKHNIRINSLFCYLGNPIQQYFFKKPTLLFNLVIVGFFCALKKTIILYTHLIFNQWITKV